MPMPLLSGGAQHWAEDSGGGPTSAGQMGRITSPALLAPLRTLRPLVAFASVVVHQDPKVIHRRAAFQLLSPSLYWCTGLSLPRGRAWHFPWLNFMRLPPGPSSSLRRSLLVAALVCQALLPGLCHAAQPRHASFHPFRR